MKYSPLHFGRLCATPRRITACVILKALTTPGLIGRIPAVPHSIADEDLRYAAAQPVTAQSAALCGQPAAQLIGAVLTLRGSVTHLLLVNTHLPMGTLELACRKRTLST